MSRKRNRIVSLALGLLAVAASLGAVAWACTPAAYITLPQGTFQPGSSVTVSGDGFIPGPVEVRWGGEVLATPTGPSFAVSITVPSVAPGTYYVEAVARDANGQTVGHASRAIKVGGPAASSPQTPAGPGAAAPAPATSPDPAPVGARLVADGSPGDRSRTPSGRSGGGDDSRPAAGQAGGSQATATAAPSRARATQRGRTQAGRAAVTGAARRTGLAPSSHTASGDLWSGFEANGRAASLTGADAPHGRPGSELTVGLGLLSLGLLALGGGIAAARRRARAPARGAR